LEGATRKLISDYKFTLGKEERLKSRKAIEGLFRDGKSFALFPYRVYYILSGQGHSTDVAPGVAGSGRLQAGFGASSRNFKKAVDRNRIKRLTREAYRLLKKPLQEGLEEKGRSLILFIIYTGKELPEYPLVTQKMGLVLQKLVKEAGV
jgi:ribonuclease P protein component